MINIEVYYNNCDQIIGFEAKGHGMDRNRAEKYDLVCCAVSVLTITTVNGITDYLGIKPGELFVHDGWLKMLLPVNEDSSIAVEDKVKSDQADALLSSMVMGLEQVAGDYDKFVKLKKRRWTL